MKQPLVASSHVSASALFFLLPFACFLLSLDLSLASFVAAALLQLDPFRVMALIFILRANLLANDSSLSLADSPCAADLITVTFVFTLLLLLLLLFLFTATVLIFLGGFVELWLEVTGFFVVV